jgi:energy-coupling factor transporter ATP-binding protein EcfA2
MKALVSVGSDVIRSPRVIQAEGIFDIPPNKRSELTWDVDLPVEEKPWNVGLIVGPSGSGKSTVARHLFKDYIDRKFAWPSDRSILDAFPAEMGIKDVIGILSSVGFSSPPSWLRPFGVLSNGEQFRVTMARLLAESGDELAVVDEFTSLVDRTVAQIGSCAIAKTVRRRGQRFVAVTCHEDVEPWLQPDWVYRPAEQRFAWRCLQRRPDVTLRIQRVHHSAWRLFKQHHYLSQDINKAATCFVAFWGETPVAFVAWLPFFGKLKDERHARRSHRTVCLPDYQGIGIGNAVFSYTASVWAGMGLRAFSNTAHPAEVKNRAASPLWRMTKAPAMTAKGHHAIDLTRASSRMMAAFEYIGPPLDRALAEKLLETWADVRR